MTQTRVTRLAHRAEEAHLEYEEMLNEWKHWSRAVAAYEDDPQEADYVQEAKKYCEQYDKASTRAALALSEARAALREAKDTEYERLTERGKAQAAALLRAVQEMPDKETLDYAITTGMSAERVLYLAHILNRRREITMHKHSRWNGQHYLKFYRLNPEHGTPNDIPF